MKQKPSRKSHISKNKLMHDNPLARFEVTNCSMTCSGSLAKNSNQNNIDCKSTDKLNANDAIKNEVEEIWEQISNNTINLSFAVVGYQYETFVPILNNEDVITLLVSYGYSVDSAQQFVQELHDISIKEKHKSFIVSYSVNSYALMRNLNEK